MLILGTELGLSANCKVPQGSDMPRAPWSSCIIDLKGRDDEGGRGYENDEKGQDGIQFYYFLYTFFIFLYTFFIFLNL